MTAVVRALPRSAPDPARLVARYLGYTGPLVDALGLEIQSQDTQDFLRRLADRIEVGPATHKQRGQVRHVHQARHEGHLSLDRIRLLGDDLRQHSGHGRSVLAHPRRQQFHRRAASLAAAVVVAHVAGRYLRRRSA